MKDFEITVALRHPSSARSISVSLVGTRCRVSVLSVSPLSLHRTAFARTATPVGTRCARPSRPAVSSSVSRSDACRSDASTTAHRSSAVRTESGQKPRPEATFRPKPAIRQPGTPLSDLPPPIHHAGTPPPAPPTPIQHAQTDPSDLFQSLPATQPTQPKPFSHKRAQRTQKPTPY